MESAYLPGSVFPGSDIFSMEKKNQTPRLARFFKVQKPSGCGATRRKCLLLMDTFPRPVHTQAFIHYYPSRQLAYSSATKLLHPSLSLASLWMVPQLWLMFFVSTSVVLHQVVFRPPRFYFPSGVQWIATLVMELASLQSTCPIQRHRILLMMVSISSCWHRAERLWLEMVLGQKMRWILLRLVV